MNSALTVMIRFSQSACNRAKASDAQNKEREHMVAVNYMHWLHYIKPLGCIFADTLRFGEISNRGPTNPENEATGLNDQFPQLVTWLHYWRCPHTNLSVLIAFRHVFECGIAGPGGIIQCYDAANYRKIVHVQS